MTLDKLKIYIEKDIKRLEKEQAAEIARLPKMGKEKTTTLTYLVTRKHTLKEILKLLPE